jgi:putative transposase
VALDQSALLEVLDALKVADVDDRIRRAAQTIYQALIEAELTAVIGAAHTNGHLPVRHSATGSAPAADNLGRRLGAADPETARRIVHPVVVGAPPAGRPGLFAVVMEAYPHGVSTRKVDDLVRALGADSGISKSEVSRICADVDSEVGAFRDRSLAGQAFPTSLSMRPTARPESTAGWSPKRWWSPLGCAPTAAARCLASRSATPRTAPFGPRSCAA